MYTYEEYSKQNMLGGYMTGTVIGFLKWSDMGEQNKKRLAKQLQWCYEQAGVEIPNSVKEEIKQILG